MSEDNHDSMEEILKSLDNHVQIIEGYSTNRRPYVDLYDAILRALPHISNKIEKRSMFSHSVKGKFGDSYMISYFSRFGITQVAVSDIRNIAENPVVREYSTGSGWGIKAPYASIWEIDTKSHSKKLIQENKFRKHF